MTLAQGFAQTLMPHTDHTQPQHLVWMLQTFDRDGNVIGQVLKPVGGAPVLHGSYSDLAYAAVDIRKIPQFFTDPLAVARAAYEAWREVLLKHPACDGPVALWEDACKDPNFLTRWLAATAAAFSCEPTCN